VAYISSPLLVNIKFLHFFAVVSYDTVSTPVYEFVALITVYPCLAGHM
jgi:hypothetical protein